MVAGGRSGIRVTPSLACLKGPGLPQGQLYFREAATMAASVDSANLTLQGTGGYGRIPHRSARCDPQGTAIIRVSVLKAGEIVNLIRDKAVLELSELALWLAVRDMLLQRIHQVTQVALAQSMCADIGWCQAYPVLVNWRLSASPTNRRSGPEHCVACPEALAHRRISSILSAAG